MAMSSGEIAGMIETLQEETGPHSAPVQIQTQDGDLLDVEEVRFSPLNGGMIVLIAGPAED